MIICMSKPLNLLVVYVKTTKTLDLAHMYFEETSS